MQNAEKPLLVNVIDFQRDIAPYKFIKIFAGVGSGKTSLACSMICGDSKRNIPKQTTLLITSRRSTVEETLRKMGKGVEKRACAYGNLPNELELDYEPEYDEYVRIIKEEESILCSEVTVHNKSVVCTNAHIEQYFKRQYIPSQRSSHLWELFDTIIVDEVHSLITDATYQSAPFYVLELINEFLRRCTEHDIQNEDKKHLILMTGTPEPLNILGVMPFSNEQSAVYHFFEECPNVQPRAVTVIDTKTAFIKLHSLLKSNEKAIWFSNHVVTKQRVQKDWHIDKSVRVEVSFSSDDAKRSIGDDEVKQMKDINDFISQNRRLPDDVRLFISTSRNKEGINIENEDIRYMFVESHFSDDVIQMAGRLRVGAENLYIIADTKQLCTGANLTAVDFAAKGIAPLQDKFCEANQGYANKYLSMMYGVGKTADIPFNLKAEDNAYTAYGSYINYIHETFPYVRYSYILNRFVLYKQKELAEAYTLKKCNDFSDAVIKGNKSVKKLLESWFPNAMFYSMATIEERCKEYIEHTVFGNAKYTSVKLPPKQKDELQQELSKITGKPITYLNTVIGNLGYKLSKQDRHGNYWISRGEKAAIRMSPKKRQK